MAAFRLSTYIAADSSVHRYDARSKLFLLLVYSVCLFFVDTWVGMAGAAALLFAVLAASQLPIGRVLGIAVPVYVLAAFTVAANALTYVNGGFSFTEAGLVRGCFFAARILLLVWASLIVCFSTTSTQLSDALIWALQPLRRLHVPVDDIAMVFSIALRFIPVTAEEYLRIRDAQWSRCAPLDEGPLIARVRAQSAILVPLLVGLFRRADVLAQAMDARCYGMPGVVRTPGERARMSMGALLFMIAFAALCVAGAVFL